MTSTGVCHRHPASPNLAPAFPPGLPRVPGETPQTIEGSEQSPALLAPDRGLPCHPLDHRRPPGDPRHRGRTPEQGLSEVLNGGFLCRRPPDYLDCNHRKCAGTDSSEDTGTCGIPNMVSPMETSLFFLIPFLGQTPIHSRIQESPNRNMSGITGYRGAVFRGWGGYWLQAERAPARRSRGRESGVPR